MVMSGIKNIAGSKNGTYRDGGIIDYHFDFSLSNNKTDKYRTNEQNLKVDSSKVEYGLTLYPHFSSEPKAGWFDKSSNRRVLASSYENTVLLAPSQSFIQSLPYGKIPDRTDFTKLDAPTRIKYWLEVLEQTEKIAECFNNFVIKQDIAKIKAFQP
jgi:hypothetical protein